MQAQPTTERDGRFSHPAAEPTPWSRVEAVLTDAELYWLTTVRPSGRPHVTPLVGVWWGGALYVASGADEQKTRNLRSNQQVAATTGTNRWAEGLDVVVEGQVQRVSAAGQLEALAEAYRTKYNGSWDFTVGHGVFNPETNCALVFRIRPDKILAFAKDPHAQTRYLFDPQGAASATGRCGQPTTP